MVLLLTPTVNPEQMILEYIQARRRVLMFDYDGTLAPFRVERDLAAAYPGVEEALNDLSRREEIRCVIITGRSLADIKSLLRLDPLPEIIGSHGWEKRDARGGETIDIPHEFTQVLDSAELAVRKIGFGASLERKPASIAIHWRGESAEMVKEIETQAGSLWAELARQNSMALTRFDGGIELRVPGKDKGTAILEVLASEPPDAFAAFLGDDLTDEDAFAVIRDRGYGILVRKEFRRTKAQFWTQPPEGLLALLEIFRL